MSHPASKPGGTTPSAGQEWSQTTPGQVRALLTPGMIEQMQATFRMVGADEGTLWIADESLEALVPVYNSGPSANRFVGRFQQPLNSGLISMVYGSEQAFLENDMAVNRQQSKLLDQELGVKTTAMIAVPLYLLGGCRGVLSCVRLCRDGANAGSGNFDGQHLAAVRDAAQRVAESVQLAIGNTGQR